MASDIQRAPGFSYFPSTRRPRVPAPARIHAAGPVRPLPQVRPSNARRHESTIPQVSSSSSSVLDRVNVRDALSGLPGFASKALPPRSSPSSPQVHPAPSPILPRSDSPIPPFSPLQRSPSPPLILSPSFSPVSSPTLSPVLTFSPLQLSLSPLISFSPLAVLSPRAASPPLIFAPFDRSSSPPFQLSPSPSRNSTPSPDGTEATKKVHFFLHSSQDGQLSDAGTCAILVPKSVIEEIC